jgi:hypothetical protein
MISFLKKWLIEKGLKLLMGIIALSIGIWYLSSSLDGASLSYTSVDNFLKQIGVENGDIASANGCFLCGYIKDLFGVLGRATEMFWNGIVHNLWIVMAIGFGIFIIIHSINQIHEQLTSKDLKDLTNKEPTLDFKKWFDKVWKTGVRVLIAGALIGAINGGGTKTLRAVTNLVVTPVMYIGSELSLAATGIISGATCNMPDAATQSTDILTPVLTPFMCVMGNLNAVMLAGAGGGFALMNYSWLDDRVGGLFTWLAGLTLVIMFLFIGFDLLFQVLTVLFKLIFIIIFMPLMIAAAAFEDVWKLAKGIMNSCIDMLVNSAVAILKISLKISIIYAIIYLAADQVFPGPEDGFTSILPPLQGEIIQTQSYKNNMDAQAMSVMKVFSTCEQVSVIDGKMDEDKFVSCFRTQRNLVEANYPHAFDFMDDGFDFLIFMIGVFFLYFWVISPKIDALIGGKDDKEMFDYGGWVKNFGKTAFDAPVKIFTKVRDKLKEG